MKIIAHQSILHNNVTNCTFVASELDEEVQPGTRENDSHIEWMGNLNLPVPSESRIAELEAENVKLREAYDLLLEKVDHTFGKVTHIDEETKEEFSAYNLAYGVRFAAKHIINQAQQALKGKEAKGE